MEIYYEELVHTITEAAKSHNPAPAGSFKPGLRAGEEELRPRPGSKAETSSFLPLSLYSGRQESPEAHSGAGHLLFSESTNSNSSFIREHNAETPRMEFNLGTPWPVGGVHT